MAATVIARRQPAVPGWRPAGQALVRLPRALRERAYQPPGDWRWCYFDETYI